MEVSTVVIDNGAYAMRAGMGGDTEPQCIIPTIIGRPKDQKPAAATTLPKKEGSEATVPDYFIGSDVFSQNVELVYKCPIENRVITKFDDIEKIWSYIFTNELHINTEEHPVLLTESPQNPKATREKTIQIMMETFNVPAYYSTYPEVLSLYASGLTTGCVIDAGETITHIVPVYECFSMTHVAQRLEVGGRQINGFLKTLLIQNGIELQSSNERDVLRNIKETLCYIPSDYNAELDKIEHVNDIEKNFLLPEGQEIRIGAPRFKAPQPLFDPQLVHVASPGLHQIVNEVISKTDDLRSTMYENILLTGGTSMFPGLAERLEKDISPLAQGNKCKVLDPDNRKNSAWIGGSIMVSLATFSQMWIMKAEYNETGPSVVHLKCF